MTGEKYVSQIVKKIQCGKDRKDDISRQLMTEINERIAQGETIEDIIHEMGSAAEVAESFNENVSPEARKKYKKKKLAKVIIAVIVVLGVLFAVIYTRIPKINNIGESGYFTAQEVEEQIITIIDLLDNGDYEALQEMAIPQMASVLNTDTMEQAKKQVCPDFGQRLSIGNIYAQEVIQQKQVFAVVQVNVSYEQIAVTYTITLDSEMKLAGLYMK